MDNSKNTNSKADESSSKTSKTPKEWADSVEQAAHDAAELYDHDPDVIRAELFERMTKASKTRLQNQYLDDSKELIDRGHRFPRLDSLFPYEPEPDANLIPIAPTGPTIADAKVAIDFYADTVEAAVANAVDPPAPKWSDIDVTEQFVSRCGRNLCHDGSGWLTWSGSGWSPDKHGVRTNEMAKMFCTRTSAAQLRAGHIDQKMASRIASEATMTKIVRMARTVDGIYVPAEKWNTNPMILNTPGGIVDLTTGILRCATRTDYVSQSATVPPSDWDASLMTDPFHYCPEFGKFLLWAVQGDRDLLEYLQRVFGYVLTADFREHAYFFFYGGGENGKSTLIDVMSGILGDYARPMDLRAIKKSNPGYEHIPTELAYLMGSRLAVAQEQDTGYESSLAAVKRMASGDRQIARKMRQDPVEFMPTFKMVFASNQRPTLGTVDKAIRRRLHMIEFTAALAPGQKDTSLGDKLKREWPAILRWALTGCLVWQRTGLEPPAAVLKAADEYLDEEDLQTQWIADCCETGRSYAAPSVHLFRSWREWASTRREPVGTHHAFTSSLLRKKYLDQGKEVSFMRHRIGPERARGISGIRLR